MPVVARLLVPVMLAAASAALAQGYPNRPIKVIVPWPPGQATDTAARVVSDKMGIQLGQQFIIDNRPGAGGTIGTEHAAKAAREQVNPGFMELTGAQLLDAAGGTFVELADTAGTRVTIRLTGQALDVADVVAAFRRAPR